MGIRITSLNITSETRFPFRTPDPSNTIDTIIASLVDIESSIDSEQVDSEITELETGGEFFSQNSRPCLNIKLRNAKAKELKKFGCLILPITFGNLVYLVKYEYLDAGFFDLFSGNSAIERARNIKKKLNTLDKWMEYTFIQTLGDYVYVEMLQKHDPNYQDNLKSFQTFLSVV